MRAREEVQVLSYEQDVLTWDFQVTNGYARTSLHITKCVDIVKVFPVDGKLIFLLFVDWGGGGCIQGRRR